MKSKLVCLGLVIITTIAWSQQPDATGNRTPARQGHAGRDAFQTAMKAEPADREAALRNLVKTANEDYATESLTALIRSRAPDLESLSLALLQRLSDINMANLLGTAARTRDMHFRAVLARGVLQRMADNPPPPRSDRDGSGAAGFAATLLTNSRDVADRALIGRGLRIRPYDTGIWLAVAKMGITDEAEVSLARSVMQDKQASGRTRLAVASALAPMDSSAREFVVSTLTSFLDKFVLTDAELIVAGLYSKSPYDVARGQELMWNIRYLGTLEFLQTPDAERITFDYIGSTNILVRRALGLVAVMRWPKRFLTLQSPHLDERAKLVAALSLFHPDLLPLVQAVVAPDELDKFRQLILKGGIESLFDLPGGAGLIF